ncbi:MAG: PAS domain S-box protein [Dehalococcoidia bacterium]
MARDAKARDLVKELATLRARIASLEVAERDNRLTQEALRESEGRYHNVFQHSNDAIFIIDLAEDKILDANPKACDMLGYSHEELLATPISTVHQHEMPKMQEFGQLVSERGHGWTNELSCRTSVGRILPCEMSASMIDIGGKSYAISIVRDITERKEAESSLRELAVLEERNRLAREIHDSLAQGLTGLIWQLNVMERGLESEGASALQALARVRGLAKECLHEARRSVWDLRSGPLQGLSLAQALDQEMTKTAGDAGLQSSFDVSGQERVLPTGVEAAVLRICQEALANVVKHAKATQVNVTLAYDDPNVRLTVQDNGIGFDPEVPRTPGRDAGGFGLISMRERARILGGEVTVESRPGQGTVVKAILSTR